MFGPLGNQRYAEYADNISDAGSHLSKIIGDLLDVSQVEMGELEIGDETVDLHKTLADCMTMVRDHADRADVTLTTEVEEDMPDLRADGRRVKQILLNLLSNAIKFTPGKGIVGVKVDIGRDNGITFRVTDTGLGITDDDIPRITTPFGQVSEAYTSNSQEGVGLGLPLVKSLTELHGGTLRIESILGKGTRVTVAFPPERTI